jgi:hypothetical protein
VERVAGAASGRCIPQRINPHVFRQPVKLMQNIERVTEYLADPMPGLTTLATWRARPTARPRKTIAGIHVDFLWGVPNAFFLGKRRLASCFRSIPIPKIL